MSKGRERDREKKQALADLGRDLSRRSGSRCELCEARGKLEVIEVKGGPKRGASTDWALLLCERCADLVADRRRYPDAEQRFLETAIWSELAPAQIAAARQLKRLADQQVTWASEAWENAWLPEEIQELL